MKLPFSSKLRLPLITPCILHSGVRRLRCSCWALCAASCFLFSAVSRAQLTQADIEQAIQNAFSPYFDFDVNGDDSLRVFSWVISDTLDTISYDIGQYGPYLPLILAAIQAQQSGDTNLVEFLRPFLESLSFDVLTISGNVNDIGGEVQSIALDAARIQSDVHNLSSDVSFYGSLWDQIRDGDKWKVHDSELQSALAGPLANIDSTVDGISESLGGISDSASGIQDSISSIDERLSSINQNWLTKDQLQDVIDSADEPPHDEPPDDSGEKEQAERSAEYEWNQAESTSYTNRWELAEWKYTEMLPGNASIVSDNPSDNPGGTGFSPDDSGIPLFARLVEAQEFGMSINSSVIEPGDYPVFMSYYNEFRVRWGRIFHAVWDFVGAFMVFFIARREWKYYMGVGDNSPEVETDSGGIF